MNLLNRYLEQTKKECVFCNPCEDLIIMSSANFTLMYDPFALIPGHLLLTSKGHFGCLGEVTEDLFAECESIREYGYKLLAQHFGASVTRYEHGRAGHCIANGDESHSCHHYHEHLLPASLNLHAQLENLFKCIVFDNENSITDLFYRYHEYLLVVESDGIKRFYVAKSDDVPPHLLRTLAAQALNVPHLHDWQAYSSCENMLAGKNIINLLDKAS